MPQADAELEAKIVPDESAIEEVENRELEMGGGGDLSASQRNNREQVISGGFRSAIKALGLTAILSSLKPITATLGAILGVISRSLVPVVETIAEFIRPFVEGANSIVEDTKGTVDEVVSSVQNNPLEFGVSSVNLAGIANFARNNLDFSQVGNQNNLATDTNVIETLSEALAQSTSNRGGGSPDQSGEASKIDELEKFRDAFPDKIGNIS